MNSQQLPNFEPDPDAIKMFVGQIPRNMDENDLHKLLGEFGPIYQLNVLHDKATGNSKGEPSWTVNFGSVHVRWICLRYDGRLHWCNKYVHCLMINISMACDLVDHLTLIQKLKALNIVDNIIQLVV